MSASGSGSSGSSGAAPTVSGGAGGSASGGPGTPGDGGNFLQRLVRDWIAPSALAAVVIAILGWFLVDKFAAINQDIKDVKSVTDHLDTRLNDADKANRALSNLLNSRSINLVDRINNTNLVVNNISGELKLLNQKIDGVSHDIKGVQSSVALLAPLPNLVGNIDGRTTRLESIMMKAPWATMPKQRNH